jgi:PKD repeat protein
MKSLLSFLFSIMVLASVAQQSRKDRLITASRTTVVTDLKSLEAKFTADITQGAAPLTVQFTDQSTGNPLSWKWAFGDGDSSLVQNPLHVYQSSGVYSVKLTISDGTSGFALEKTDYIRATQDYVNCDTLRYPLPEPLTYYIIPGKGYVAGNNTYGDLGISDFFENIQPNLAITGMICEFGIAKQKAGNDEKLLARVWKHETASGKPGLEIGTDTLQLSALVNDVTNKKTTTLDFNSPVLPGGSFYMGVMLPALTGDTLCFWSTSSGKFPVNTTWILQSDHVWESAQTLWTPNGGAAFTISGAIYPKICLLNGIGQSEIPVPFAIWPNPAQGSVSIVNQTGFDGPLVYRIFNVSGKKVLDGLMSRAVRTSINIELLKPGIYVVRIQGEKSVTSVRLVVR